MLLYISTGFAVTTLAVLAINTLVYGSQGFQPVIALLDGGVLLSLSAPAVLAAWLLRRRGNLVVGTAFVAIAVATNLVLRMITAASVALTQHVGFTPVVVDGALTATGLVGYTIYGVGMAVFGIAYATFAVAILERMPAVRWVLDSTDRDDRPAPARA